MFRYKRSFEGAHWDAKNYWNLPASLWNSTTAITLTSRHTRTIQAMQLIDMEPQTALWGVAYSINVSHKSQCLEKTWVFGCVWPGIEYIMCDMCLASTIEKKDIESHKGPNVGNCQLWVTAFIMYFFNIKRLPDTTKPWVPTTLFPRFFMVMHPRGWSPRDEAQEM